MLLPIPQAAVIAPQTTAPATPEVLRPDVVVTARRRPKPLDGVKPQDTLSAGQIGVYGARSIGDLIEKLRDDRGGQPFSIVVNGRRIESIADIAALPAEALESIQLYSPAEGGRFGFSPPGQLLNLTLKKHFRWLSLEMQGSGSTDGGAASVRDTGSGVMIDNDRRSNVNINVLANAGLLASQRPRDPTDPRDLGGDRSLVPRSRSLNVLFGASRPVGDGILDMNMATSMSRSISRMTAAIGQSSDLDSLRLSASYNRQIYGLFANLSAHVDAQQSRLRTAGVCAATATACALQAVDTDNLGASLGMNLNGKVAKIPTGLLQFDLFAQRGTVFTSVRDRVQPFDRRTVYATTNSRGSLTLPLLAAGSALSKRLGTLEVKPAIDYSGVDGLGGAWGRSVGVQWAPFDGLSINASLGRRAALPSNDQINAPATILVGRTAFDYRIGALVPVEQVIGGAPLARQSTRDREISAMFSKQLGTKRLSAHLNYSSSAIDRPPFSIIDPSLFLERAFPNRFVRDADGTLIRVDTRPLSAVRRSSESLSGAISMGGRWGGIAPQYADAINWSISLNARRRLQESLLLAPGVPAIDLLATPLTISTGAQGRNDWNAALRVASMRGGGSISATLNSGLTSSVFGDPATGVRVGSLAQMHGDLFFNLPQPQAAKGKSKPSSQPYRLDLSVRNLFNSRPNIETFTPSGTTRLNPWLLDPMGRTITLSLRVPLGGS